MPAAFFASSLLLNAAFLLFVESFLVPVFFLNHESVGFILFLLLFFEFASLLLFFLTYPSFLLSSECPLSLRIVSFSSLSRWFFRPPMNWLVLIVIVRFSILLCLCELIDLLRLNILFLE